MITWDQLRALIQADNGRRGLFWKDDAIITSHCIIQIECMQRHLLSEASENPYTCEEQLLTIMQATQLCNASDPRDKVYALLSFNGKKSLTTMCEADYTIQVSQLVR